MEIENWRDFKKPCKTDFVEQEPFEHFWNPCSISIFFVAVVGSPSGTANQNPDGGFNVKTVSMTSPHAKYSCNSGIIFVQDFSKRPDSWDHQAEWTFGPPSISEHAPSSRRKARFTCQMAKNVREIMAKTMAGLPHQADRNPCDPAVWWCKYGNWWGLAMSNRGYRGITSQLIWWLMIIFYWILLALWNFETVLLGGLHMTGPYHYISSGTVFS